MVKINDVFKPEYNYELLRIGSDHDGGYLIEKNSLYESDYLVSFGISTNWIFEDHFLTKNKVPMLAFDGSINDEFWNSNKKEALKKLKKLSFNKIIQHYFTKKKFDIFFNNTNYIPKYISKTLSNSLTFHDAMKLTNGKRIFLKIDIEGSEYELLDDLIKYQEFIWGLAIEFHEFSKNEKKIISFINNLNLKIVHIHINNYDFDEINNTINAIELSFSKNPQIESEFKHLPHPLDRPNNKKKVEIKINFE